MCRGPLSLSQVKGSRPVARGRGAWRRFARPRNNMGSIGVSVGAIFFGKGWLIMLVGIFCVDWQIVGGCRQNWIA